MKITNKHNLPDAFLNFARDDKYTRGKAEYQRNNTDRCATSAIDERLVRQ